MKTLSTALILASMILSTAAKADDLAAQTMQCSGLSMYGKSSVSLTITADGQGHLNYGPVTADLSCVAQKTEGDIEDFTHIWDCNNLADQEWFSVFVMKSKAYVSGHSDFATVFCGG